MTTRVHTDLWLTILLYIQYFLSNYCLVSRSQTTFFSFLGGTGKEKKQPGYAKLDVASIHLKSSSIALYMYSLIRTYIHSPYSVFLPQRIKILVYATHISLHVVIVGQTQQPKIALRITATEFIQRSSTFKL